ncbi:MAG: DUF2793 domain-containing protein [Pseudomonadota bacterium]
MRINIGATANDGTGDQLRTWAQKFNAHFSVISRSTVAEPGSPSEGDLYIVPASATGANWAGQDGDLAFFINAAWEFMTPFEGWRFWVNDENLKTIFDGTSWITESSGGGGITFTRGATITADYTLTAGDLAGGVYREIDASSGPVTITVPDGIDGAPFEFARIDATANAVAFAAGGSATLDARGGTLSINDQWQAGSVVPRSSDFFLLVGV